MPYVKAFTGEAGYTTMISHKSGETEDTFIAVGLSVGQIKTRSMVRT